MVLKHWEGLSRALRRLEDEEKKNRETWEFKIKV